MVVSNGIIVDIDKKEIINKKYHLGDIIYFDGIICPGFVNTHTHLQYTLCTDFIDHNESFINWLKNVIMQYPNITYNKWLMGYMQGYYNLISTGTTCVADIVSDYRLLSIINNLNIRGRFYLELAGIAYGDVYFKIKKDIIDYIELYKDKLNIGISPHSLYTIDLKIIDDILKLSNDNNYAIHMHFAESYEEMQLISNGSGKLSDLMRPRWSKHELLNDFKYKKPIEVLINLFNKYPNLKSHLAHLTQCKKDDLIMIDKEGINKAICVRSNKMLSVGKPDIDYLLSSEKFGLGTDSLASSPSLNILDEVRAFKLLTIDDKNINRILFNSITLEGAKTLFLDHLYGSLHANKYADFLVFLFQEDNKVEGDNNIDELIRYIFTQNKPEYVFINGNLIVVNK